MSEVHAGGLPSPEEIFDPEKEPDFYMSFEEARGALDRWIEADLVNPKCHGRILGFHYFLKHLEDDRYIIGRREH